MSGPAHPLTSEPDSAADAESPPPRRFAASVRLALSDIKIAHSVFAMPFALLGAFMAAAIPRIHERNSAGAWIVSREYIDWPYFSAQLVLIALCMFFARTWAMLVNRLADRLFDRTNPRTERRVFASESISARRGWWIVVASGAAFIACCAAFLFVGNPFPLILSVPVLAWIALYSYSKRFTALCHVLLGSALAASPIAASIAANPPVWYELFGIDSYVTPDAEPWAIGRARALLSLSAFVLFWVAGFDVAYAIQDIDFDRRAGLHSIPARLGVRGALWVSRGFHALAFMFLLLAWRADPRFGAIFLAAVAVVAALLAFEHIVLARRGVAGLPLAFFTLNGVVSCVLGAAGIADVLI